MPFFNNYKNANLEIVEVSSPLGDNNVRVKTRQLYQSVRSCGKRKENQRKYKLALLLRVDQRLSAAKSPTKAIIGCTLHSTGRKRKRCGEGGSIFMTSSISLNHARYIFETKDLGQDLSCPHRFISIPASLVHYLNNPAHIQCHRDDQAIRRKSNRLHSYQRCARRRVRPLLLDPFHLYHPASLVPACWR